MNDAALSVHADTQINWLELARLAAAGAGHNDLGRGVHRLATLAAATHRQRVADLAAADVSTSTTNQGRGHGRTPGEARQAVRPGTEAGQ